MGHQIKATLISHLGRQSIWPWQLLVYSTGIERDMDLVDMHTYAAAAGNSHAREEILIARIETVTINFENIHETLRGCADDDDIVRNIRNLQAACPSLQEASIISIESLTHIEECLGLLGEAFTAALVQCHERETST